MKTFYDKINPNSLLIITRASVARPYSFIILTTAIKIPLMFFNVKISLFQIICQKNFRVSFVCCSRKQLFCRTFVTLLCVNASFIRLSLQTTCLNASVLCSILLLFQSIMGPFGAHFSSYTCVCLGSYFDLLFQPMFLSLVFSSG